MLKKPYRRICRPGPDGKSYTRSGLAAYITHPDYAPDARMYVRAYLLLEADLRALFEYIEPADENQATFSMRNHALLVRACVEVEANARSILRANGLKPKSEKDRWNMGTYKKLEVSHHLSSYRVSLPDWHGDARIRCPFGAWADLAPLPWYEAHHSVKHDRAVGFRAASLENVVDAVCGCLVILTAQFLDQDFSGRLDGRVTERPDDGFESAIGGYFRVSRPVDFSPAEMYDFDPGDIAEQDSLATFDYDRPIDELKR